MDALAQLLAGQGVAGLIIGWMLYLLWDKSKEVRYWQNKHDNLRTWVDGHLVDDVNAERRVREKTDV